MKVTCNGDEIEIDDNSLGRDLANLLGLTSPSQAAAITINHHPSDFSDKLNDLDHVHIYSFEDKEGKEVFWHSSAHVLAQAILRLYPDAKLTIGPPIENGFYYDFANLDISEKDFAAIEKEMKKIISENLKPQKYTFESKKAAIERFKNNPYKLELINDLPDDAILTGYEQGEFFDLCRGPHLPSLNKIKAIKLLKTSAAYWRGDQEREMLTRIYGITFPDRQQLKDYLHALEEAKKRDHRVLGQKLGLFLFSEKAPGMPIFKQDGMTIWNHLVEFWQELHKKAGYGEIRTPMMMDQSLWEQSGHWQNYRENMYTCEIDEKTYAIKPMNCPACMLTYKSQKHSYRELPIRIAELGTVHRHELSGSLSGLLRVRCFTQDDAHIFMTKTQIKSEILGVLQLVDKIYKTFGLEYHLELSTRPEKNTIGSDEDWELTTNALREALEAWGKKFILNEGDGAFYGPKIDMHVRDAIGRTWQCGTIQLDMSLPEKFDLEYTDSDGSSKRPIMIHRALYGSIERFFAILIEHFKGRFPLWLSPKQVRVLPVADRHVDYAEKLKEEILAKGLDCDIDSQNESISKKVRTAQVNQINYMIIVGDKELESRSISLRTRDNKLLSDLTLNQFLTDAIEEKQSRSLISPFQS